MKKIDLLIFLAILGLLGLVAGSFYWVAGQRSGSNTKLLEANSFPKQMRVLAIAHLELAGKIVTITGTLGGRVTRLEVAEYWVKSF